MLVLYLLGKLNWLQRPSALTSSGLGREDVTSVEALNERPDLPTEVLASSKYI
jgi:hypothetical protein